MARREHVLLALFSVLLSACGAEPDGPATDSSGALETARVLLCRGADGERMRVLGEDGVTITVEHQTGDRLRYGLCEMFDGCDRPIDIRIASGWETCFQNVCYDLARPSEERLDLRIWENDTPRTLYEASFRCTPE